LSLAKANAMEAKAKILYEEREIMFIYTSNMTAEQKACVEKRRGIFQQRDA
jgi:hypothetical protein